MKNLLLALPLLLVSLSETYSQALPRPTAGTDIPGHADAAKPAGDSLSLPAANGDPGDTGLTGRISADGHPLAMPADSRAVGLEGFVKGNQLILDWSAIARPPAAFRILHPSGRFIAARLGKRSAQGWISAVRVAGWPSGIYLAEVSSGNLASSARILIP